MVDEWRKRGKRKRGQPDLSGFAQSSWGNQKRSPLKKNRAAQVPLLPEFATLCPTSRLIITSPGR
jgi:hypothetical protein